MAQIKQTRWRQATDGARNLARLKMVLATEPIRPDTATNAAEEDDDKNKLVTLIEDGLGNDTIPVCHSPGRPRPKSPTSLIKAPTRTASTNAQILPLPPTSSPSTKRSPGQRRLTMWLQATVFSSAAGQQSVKTIGVEYTRSGHKSNQEKGLVIKSMYGMEEAENQDESVEVEARPTKERDKSSDGIFLSFSLL